MNEVGIFVNYRVGDEENTAALLANRLRQQFGDDNVFFASESIMIGTPFDAAIMSALDHAAALVAVIGSRWVDARNPRGRCLDQETDWVRRELAAALARAIPVVPILVGAVNMPPEAALPDDIRALARRQYRRLAHRSVEADVAGLIDALVTTVPVLARFRAPPTGSRDEGINVTHKIGTVGDGAAVTGVRDRTGSVTHASIHQEVREVGGDATIVGYDAS